MPTPEFVYTSQFHQRPLENRRNQWRQSDPEFAALPRGEQEALIRVYERAAANNPVAQESAAARVSPAPTARPPVGEGILGDIQLGERLGRADLLRSVSSAASILPESIGGGVRTATREMAESAMPSPEELRSRSGLLGEIVQGVAATPYSLIKYAPAAVAGRAAPLVAAATGALSHAEEGPRAAGKAALFDAAGFYLGGKALGLESRAARAAGTAGAQGAIAAIESGGDVQQTAIAAGMGGVFGAASARDVRVQKETIGKLAKNAGETFNRVFAPTNRSEQAGITGRIFRAQKGEEAQRMDQAFREVKEAQRYFYGQPAEKQHDFIYAMQTGQYEGSPGRTVPKFEYDAATQTMVEAGATVKAINLTPQESEYARKLRAVFASKEKELRDTGRMDTFYTNYYPNIWEDVDLGREFVTNWMHGRRPLSGSQAFLKERTFPTIYDGLNAKLKPVSDNPVQLAMLKLGEIEKFLTSHRIQKDMHEAGLLTFVAEGKRGPKGMAPIEDPAFSVFAQKSGAYYSPTGEKEGAKLLRRGSISFRERVTKGDWKPVEGLEPGREKAGSWWAPEPAVNVINNYLGAGLRGHPTLGPVVRGITEANAMVNNFQLGFSAFHLGFTSFDAAISQVAIGTMRVAEGLKRRDPAMVASAFKSWAEAPFSPVSNAMRGYDLRKEWNQAGSTGNKRLADLVAAMKEAGGRAEMDPIYKTRFRERMHKALGESDYIKAGLMSIGAVPEKVSSYMMEKIVPWQKLGVFARMAEFELERMPRLTAPGPGSITIGGAIYDRDGLRRALGKAWDSVDNRMGQLVYDNLFWNRTVKDISHMLIRSVGWNLGTFREVLGGALDAAKWSANLVRPGKEAEFTHRMAYLTGLSAVTALFGSTMTYLMTGKPAEDWRDLIYPKTGKMDPSGKAERMAAPTYAKEIVGWSKEPATHAAYKFNSLLWVWADMMENQDFMRTQIADSADPLADRVFDYAKHIGTTLLKPMSLGTWERAKKRGFTPLQQAAGFIGFTPAPVAMTKSHAEQLLDEITYAKLPAGEKSKPAAAKRDIEKELERAVRNEEDWQTIAKQAMEAGKLRRVDVQRVVKAARRESLPARFKELRELGDVVRVFEAADPEQQDKLRPILRQKMMGGRLRQDMANREPESAQRFYQRVIALLPEMAGTARPPVTLE